MINRYEQEYFSDIVKNSINISDVTRNLGLPVFCGNRQTVKNYIELYNLDVSHFKNGVKKSTYHNKFTAFSLDCILVENSTYRDTTKLKNKLYKEGLKERECELCGQGEEWEGKKMSLILDHINGINNDNRIENLQIVCPNCNATLPTHGGKNAKNKKYTYKTTPNKDLFCNCGNKKDRKAKTCIGCYNKINRRLVERPPYEQLIKEIKETNYCAVGRKYGVSDAAIRKWKKEYEKNMDS